MPLKRGTSKTAVSSNVREMIAAYRKKGTIGNVRPRNLAHAKKIAVAAALNKSRKSR